MNCGIYNIVSKIDGKLYIGYATDIKKRWSKHRSNLKSKSHKNIHLQRAYDKYGENNFKFERIEICDREQLPAREHYWCTLLNVHNDNCGYNIEPTSDTKYHNRSKETIEKVRISNTGKKRTVETCRKLSELHKGRKHSPETIEKRVVANRGKKKRPRSEEQKQEMSINRSKETILQFDLEGNLIAEWRSATYAAKISGMVHSAIVRNCNGTYKQHKGYIWKYKDEKLREKKYEPYMSKRKNPLKSKEKLKERKNKTKKEYSEKNPEKLKIWNKRAKEKRECEVKRRD